MLNEYENLMAKHIGDYKHNPVFFDSKIGYVIEDQRMYLRAPTKEELKEIKVEFGDLEVKLNEK